MKTVLDLIAGTERDTPAVTTETPIDAAVHLLVERGLALKSEPAPRPPRSLELPFHPGKPGEKLLVEGGYEGLLAHFRLQLASVGSSLELNNKLR